MVITIIIAVICLFIIWLLIAPVIVEIDTRIPEARMQWMGIGNCKIWYSQQWLLHFQVLFYHKTVRLGEKTRRKKKPADDRKKVSTRKSNVNKNIRKGIRVISSFKILQWQLAIDTGDYSNNAMLYCLNFNPALYDHLQINFGDENYLFIRIRNQVWKMLYAFIRK